MHLTHLSWPSPVPGTVQGSAEDKFTPASHDHQLGCCGQVVGSAVFRVIVRVRTVITG